MEMASESTAEASRSEMEAIVTWKLGVLCASAVQ